MLSSCTSLGKSGTYDSACIIYHGCDGRCCKGLLLRIRICYEPPLIHDAGSCYGYIAEVYQTLLLPWLALCSSHNLQCVHLCMGYARQYLCGLCIGACLQFLHCLNKWPEACINESSSLMQSTPSHKASWLMRQVGVPSS